MKHQLQGNELKNYISRRGKISNATASTTGAQNHINCCVQSSFAETRENQSPNESQPRMVCDLETQHGQHGILLPVYKTGSGVPFNVDKSGWLNTALNL